VKAEPPPAKHGPILAGLKLGPAIYTQGGGAQLALGLDLGYAVDRAQNFYLMLSPQVHFVNGWSLIVPAGVQWDIPLPFLRGLYIYPRVQLGYALLNYSYLEYPAGGTPSLQSSVAHAGIFLPE